MLERALLVLDRIASGDVKAQTVTKDGEVVEVEVAPAQRVAAAKAILSGAGSVSRVNGGKMTIENANVIAAGDLIAQVDPERLRAAMRRLRKEV